MISETIQSIKNTEARANAIVGEAEKQCIEILNVAAAQANQISETQKTEMKSRSEKDMAEARKNGEIFLESGMKAIAEEVELLKSGAAAKKAMAVDLVITKLV